LPGMVVRACNSEAEAGRLWLMHSAQSIVLGDGDREGKKAGLLLTSKNS
jgi:hypothetical protein